MEFRRLLVVLLALLGTGQAYGVGGLDTSLQLLKQQALELERDVLILEEQIEHPLVIYFSLQASSKFRLQSLHILLDGQPLITHEYDSVTRSALRKGGAQLVYQGKLAAGEHELIAYYRNSRDYQRGSKQVINKTLQAKFIEVVVRQEQGTDARSQPEVTIREWDHF